MRGITLIESMKKELWNEGAYEWEKNIENNGCK